MSLNGYQRWGCDSLADDYNEDLIAYSGCDMEDAYQAGVKYRKRTESLEQENESLRGLIGANIRVTEQEAEKRMNPLPWCETLNEPYYKINLRLCFSREGWKEKQAGQPMSVIIPWIDKLIEEDKKQV